jgi:hypothetical protein
MAMVVGQFKRSDLWKMIASVGVGVVVVVTFIPYKYSVLSSYQEIFPGSVRLV